MPKTKIYFLRIKTTDKKGDEIRKAKPSLTINGKIVNLKYDQKMSYYVQLTEPGRLLTELGECTLTISAPGYSSVVQKFSLRLHEGNLTFTPHEKSPWHAAVNLLRERGNASDSWSAINFVVTVTLYEPSEVVIVAGFDYPTTKHPKGGGTNFELFGNSRVSELEAKKVIDKGTVITCFNFKDGKKKTLKKVKSGKSEKWKNTKEETQGDGAPLTSEYVKDDGHIYCESKRNIISMTHVYDYIINVGKKRPRTIKEFSIFSHAWQGGPILLNTLDIAQSGINGYAVKAADTKGATISKPKILTITDRDEIGSKQAKQVKTGDVMPEGADAVVVIGGLGSRQINGQIEVYIPVKPADNVKYMLERNPEDKDCRLKDFNSRNMPDIGHFKKSFHRDCTIRIWGCNAAKLFQQIIRQILKTKKDSDTLEITYRSSGGKPITIGPVTRKWINDRMKLLLADHTYMGRMAKASDVKTYGALLGLGASYGHRGKNKCMYIDKKKMKRFLDYYKKQLNVKVDEYGYGLYEP